MYGSGIVVWRGMEMSRLRVRIVQMDCIGGLLGIRRKYKITNARVIEMCGLRKGGEK